MNYNFVITVMLSILLPSSISAKDIGSLKCEEFKSISEEEAAEYGIKITEDWYKNFAAQQLEIFQLNHPDKDITDIKNQILNYTNHSSHPSQENTFFWIVVAASEQCKENQTFQNAIQDIILYVYNVRKLRQENALKKSRTNPQ